MSRLLFDDEDYYFQINEALEDDKQFVLIIYDIVDNKKRIKFSKMLEGYGKRVQKSAFEAMLSSKSYNKLMEEIPKYVSVRSTEDSVRIYRITGKGKVISWGDTPEPEEDVILIYKHERKKNEPNLFIFTDWKHRSCEVFL